MANTKHNGPIMASNIAKFILFLLFLVSSEIVASAQETYTDEELEIMLDEDLEHICTLRGFALVKDHVDEETGEVYTLQHADYVQAAKKCLSIETEINEILEEHPELKEELEEEIIKMEKEQKNRRDELEKLKQRMQENEGASSEASFSDRTAFVGKPRSEEDVVETDDVKTEQRQEIENETQDEAQSVQEDTGNESVDFEEEQSQPQSQPQRNENDEEIKEETSDANSKEDKMEGLEFSEEERVPLNEHEAEALEARKASTDDDLTLDYIRKEFIKYVKKDIERFTKILVPFFQPMVNAGDLVIRYVRAALSALKGAYSYTKTEEETSARKV